MPFRSDCTFFSFLFMVVPSWYHKYLAPPFNKEILLLLLLLLYNGETGRLFKFRINEHKKAVLKEDITNSAMTAHFKLLHANTAASIRTFTVNILDNCNGYLDQKILEAYHIIN